MPPLLRGINGYPVNVLVSEKVDEAVKGNVEGLGVESLSLTLKDKKAGL